jgi:hypothetical protein
MASSVSTIIMEVNSLWLLRPVQLYLRICPFDISRMPLGWDVPT